MLTATCEIQGFTLLLNCLYLIGIFHHLGNQWKNVVLNTLTHVLSGRAVSLLRVTELFIALIFLNETKDSSVLSLFITSTIGHYCTLVFLFCSQSTAKSPRINFFTYRGRINVQNLHVGLKDATTTENMFIDLLTCFPQVL